MDQNLRPITEQECQRAAQQWFSLCAVLGRPLHETAHGVLTELQILQNLAMRTDEGQEYVKGGYGYPYLREELCQ